MILGLEMAGRNRVESAVRRVSVGRLVDVEIIVG